MKKIFAILLLCGSVVLAAEVNYDEAKVPSYTLPDPLVCLDGMRVQSVSDWETKRRPEILKLFRDQMYGYLPEILARAGNHPDFVKFEVAEQGNDALGGTAIRKQVVITFTHPDRPGKCVKAHLLIYLPKNATGPVPVFLGCNFLGNHTITTEKEIFLFHLRNGSVITEETALQGNEVRGGRICRWDVPAILKRGYGLATLHYIDVAKDSLRDCFTSGIFDLYGKATDEASRGDTEWGAITAWAWGLSRAMDYLETDRQIDASRVAVMGHSRLGKTALWAGATDPRFAITISNDSGCGGAALSRREYGETIQIMSGGLRYWFCRNFQKYGPCVDTFGIDQHELIALMAPRPVYVASAEEDRWADPKGEYLSCLYAVPVYRLYGISEPFGGRTEAELPKQNTQVGGVIGYHIRTGVHDVTPLDWEMYLNFADRHFRK
ncbi:MAG: acetylxylan esterase [Planctomycetia bacterium]|nr:acetylxylan esterase [Planctomycetia bacterium]